ncbi:MAG: anhydro-N-acetylmuramic acid kinase [Bacteroidota bacterium]|nr:anhydro-N-acetylmuramic acid kinase [Bacteroidota bacterium]
MTNNQPQEYHVIGLMSGTSLDGLDIAYCRFTFDSGAWSHEILQADTIPYAEEWKQRLLSLENTDALSFVQTDAEYGFYLGQRVSDFIVRYNCSPDFVASHGHTIFHQPEKRFTVQVGSGTALASRCRLPVVFDFRSLDVSMGGQGAPLVPIGDKLLFSDYEYCLNLGGFANVSYEHKGRRIAYDICPVNIVMNEIAERTGNSFDKDGEMASEGMISQYLLNELNQFGFYKSIPDSPKSLGKEWVIKNIRPMLDQYELSDQDLLRTFCEHIAVQIGRSLENKPKGKLLVTGGGAYNSFLMKRIAANTIHSVSLPDKKTIEFKEALIFAFLGVLRWRNEVNCLKSVTGAYADNCGGTICNGELLK